MTHTSRLHLMSLSRYAFGVVPMIFALALAGCDREQIKVQQVPKDSEQTVQTPMTAQPAATPGMAANPHAGMDMNGVGAQPQVKWTLPSGWKEKAPSEMRVGSFDAGKEGQAADVSIIPLPTDSRPEMELAYYNMWRQSLQLPAAEKVQSEPVTIGSAQGKLYEIADPKAGRIVVAALDRDGVSWYFKIRGEDAVVKEQKPAFLQFLKSISFEAAPAMVAANPQPGMSMGQPVSAEMMATAVSNPSLPAGWKEIPNPPMLLAKYVIQGNGGAMADVNVSMLGGTGGGVMANVTRWRGQLGLSPMTEEDFSKQAQTVDVAGKKGTLVDMTGTDAKTGQKTRLIGIIAPEANDTWFYKLMGDPQIVEQQKDTFTKFIQTAKFVN